MATFRKRGSSLQVLVWRLGYPDQVRTLSSKVDAERWASSVQSDRDRSLFVSKTHAEQTTFGEVLRRHMKEITPRKYGWLPEGDHSIHSHPSIKN